LHYAGSDFFTKFISMSKLPLAARHLLYLLLTMLPFLASASTNNTSSTLKVLTHNNKQTVNRLDRLDLPLTLSTSDAFTQRKIDEYMEGGHRNTEKMLGRANLYFPVFEHYLHKHGMPASLKYLAVAESMLVPGAVSSASAAGLWQLMPATARGMGLRVDGIVDERLDLHRSTEAAVIMLKELFDRFGDYHLALAAYNAGGGRVSQAIRAAGSDCYEDVKDHLPRETQRYVAAYLAAAYAVNYYDDHGLSPSEMDGVSSILIYRHTSLAEVARRTDVRASTLIRMNPMFVRAYIPDSDYGYRLRFPAQHQASIRDYFWGAQNLVELPRDEQLSTAEEVALDRGYDPYALLLGCSSQTVAQFTPHWQLELMREQMLLNYFESYRSFASL
jgi:membrane-bound lytic murein transglycosylase D